jgi:hypothetical protein
MLIRTCEISRGVRKLTRTSTLIIKKKLHKILYLQGIYKKIYQLIMKYIMHEDGARNCTDFSKLKKKKNSETC